MTTNPTPHPETKQQLLTLATQISDTYSDPRTQLTPQQFVHALHALSRAIVSGEEQCTCGQPMWPTTIGHWTTINDSVGQYAQDVTVECINGHTKHLTQF